MGIFEPVTIQLKSKGDLLICDAEDERFALENSWRYDKDGYVIRGKRIDGKYRLLRFHHEVLKQHGWEIPPNAVIDHRNKIKHDNRKENLRICSQAENNRNRNSTNNSSGYRGVNWSSKNQNWIARIRVEGRSLHLGSFPSAREAAYYYNMAAQQLHGEFAELNDL